jgi:PAS domain S-box-containing protein
MSDVDPIRVLHVDDDLEIVDLASTFLEREDDRLEIEPAETAAEALDRIAAGDIHCVISDYQLPDTDCASFVADIRDEQPGMPFILFTGRDRAQLDGDILEESVTAYLQKGSGTEQYGELADEILEAVTGNDDVRTDGGRGGSRVDLRPDGSGRAVDELRDLSALDAGDTLTVLEDALDALDDTFFVLDPDGNLVYWNDRLGEVMGYEDADIAEMEPTAFFEGDDRERVADALAEARTTGSVRVRVTAVTSDDEEFPVAFRATALTDDDGDLVGIAGIARDMTEQVAYERELERQNERLEELVGAVSHDFRNPLNVISGRMELARELGDDEHFEALGRGVDRLETLLDDLVELGRKGHTVEDTAEIDLTELANSVWSEIETGDATLTVSYEGTIDADRSRLRKLLEHLFQNAVEHAGGSASVTLGSLAEGLFYVADDGPGIPDGDREDLLEYGESRSENGTGLGLAIARRIAEAHGWSISITDSESGGTRIEIRERFILPDRST